MCAVTFLMLVLLCSIKDETQSLWNKLHFFYFIYKKKELEKCEITKKKYYVFLKLSHCNIGCIMLKIRHIGDLFFIFKENYCTYGNCFIIQYNGGFKICFWLYYSAKYIYIYLIYIMIHSLKLSQM